jgi:hypothetical protein
VGSLAFFLHLWKTINTVEHYLTAFSRRYRTRMLLQAVAATALCMCKQLQEQH